ncbi:hypothetical protein C7M84_020899 [Penaeus vannamei]|uniref:Uncharacterized protein n=1 Tax=Penaeus vannamei TaxID=6689 RepID=A0A3R7LQ01_PENVA|nr:hypothetical protein C7M84_020899 [Penaeus vannamei]
MVGSAVSRAFVTQPSYVTLAFQALDRGLHPHSFNAYYRSSPPPPVLSPSAPLSSLSPLSLPLRPPASTPTPSPRHPSVLRRNSILMIPSSTQYLGGNPRCNPFPLPFWPRSHSHHCDLPRAFPHLPSSSIVLYPVAARWEPVVRPPPVGETVTNPRATVVTLTPLALGPVTHERENMGSAVPAVIVVLTSRFMRPLITYRSKNSGPEREGGKGENSPSSSVLPPPPFIPLSLPLSPHSSFHPFHPPPLPLYHSPFTSPPFSFPPLSPFAFPFHSPHTHYMLSLKSDNCTSQWIVPIYCHFILSRITALCTHCKPNILPPRSSQSPTCLPSALSPTLSIISTTLRWSSSLLSSSLFIMSPPSLSSPFRSFPHLPLHPPSLLSPAYYPLPSSFASFSILLIYPLSPLVIPPIHCSQSLPRFCAPRSLFCPFIPLLSSSPYIPLSSSFLFSSPLSPPFFPPSLPLFLPSPLPFHSPFPPLSPFIPPFPPLPFPLFPFLLPFPLSPFQSPSLLSPFLPPSLSYPFSPLPSLPGVRVPAGMWHGLCFLDDVQERSLSYTHNKSLYTLLFMSADRRIVLPPCFRHRLRAVSVSREDRHLLRNKELISHR